MSDLIRTVTRLANPVGRRATDSGDTSNIRTEDLELFNYVQTTDLDALSEPLRQKLLFRCIVALTKWHAKWDDKTGDFAWYDSAIDAQGLGESFAAMTEVLRANLELNERVETEYKASRADGEKTRVAIRQMKVMLAIAGVAVAISVGLSYYTSTRIYETASGAKELLSETLYAVSMEQEAQAARSEAATTMDIHAEHVADVKQVEAEIAVVQAQSKSAPTDVAKVHAEKKLPKLRAKARKIRMKFEVADDFDGSVQ